MKSLKPKRESRHLQVSSSGETKYVHMHIRFYGIRIVGYGLVSKMLVGVFLRKYYSLRETRFVMGISINVVL